MFGTPIPTKAFSFTKVLSGISKTLNVANQLIPLYNQAKPLISNARNILGVLKEVNNSTDSNKKTIINTTDYEIKNEEPQDSSNLNNPTFFI